jgi:hypothetical protein
VSNISLNMKLRIRLAQSAEANKFNTYLRHLSRRRRERADPADPRFFLSPRAPGAKSL